MYKVGGILEDWIIHKDTIGIAIQEGLIKMTICYRKNYDRELEIFKSEKLDIRIKKYGSIINFSYRLGNEWYLDSCYNPHLSPHLNLNQFKQEELGLLMIFVDADSGMIEAIRFQVLSKEFRDKLIWMIEEEQSKKSIILEIYHKEAAELYMKYTSEELFKMAYENRCLVEDWSMPMLVIFNGEE